TSLSPLSLYFTYLDPPTLHSFPTRRSSDLYRKHVQHESPKNFQLDLFTPDDGHFEYYAVATNMALSLPALYDFIGGEQIELEIRSEEHTSELQSRGHLVCRLLLEKKNKRKK